MTVLHIRRGSLPSSMELSTGLRPLQGGCSRKASLARVHPEESTRGDSPVIGSVGAQSAASNERAILFSKRMIHETSAENNIWSIYHPIWNEHCVKRPRLPKPHDPSADWAESAGRPDGLTHFLGLKSGSNRMTFETLIRFVKEGQLVEDIILHGAKGVGKSALIKVRGKGAFGEEHIASLEALKRWYLYGAFLKEYLGRFAPSVEEVDTLCSTRVLHITPEELSTTPKQLAVRARRFLSRKPNRISEEVPRFVVIDRMEAVPAKAQQTLCALVDHAKAKLETSVRRQDGDEKYTVVASGANFGGDAGVRMLMATRDVSRLIASLRDRIKSLKLERVEEADGVRILVRILRIENVGYEPLAIRAIFRKHWPDLRRCIDTAKQVFCEKQFLSEINTLKVISPRTLTRRDDSVHRVKAAAALEPLRRCGICTLPPPCTHLPEEKLASMGIARRAELPQRRANRVATKGSVRNKTRRTSGIDCQDFVRHGSCRAFNSRGRCGLHHPLDAHIVDMPKPRCPQCTIHLPCGHCDYDVARQHLRDVGKAVEMGIESMISQQRRLVSDSPPEKQSFGGGHGQGSEAAAKEALVGASPGSNERQENVLTTAHGGVTENPTEPFHGAALASDPDAAHTLAAFTSTGVALPTTMTVAGAAIQEASTLPAATAAMARLNIGDHHHDTYRALNVDEPTISGEEGEPPHEAGRARGRGAGVLRKLHGLSVFRRGDLDVESTMPAPPTPLPDKISELEKLRKDAAMAVAWTVEASPGGGLTEFRALEFERRTRDLLRRLEEARRER